MWKIIVDLCQKRVVRQRKKRILYRKDLGRNGRTKESEYVSTVRLGEETTIGTLRETDRGFNLKYEETKEEKVKNLIRE